MSDKMIFVKGKNWIILDMKYEVFFIWNRNFLGKESLIKCFENEK